MIDLSLDRHDFVACVEGFARGSHLRQHVWREIVFLNIPQMSDDEMDFFRYISRRNLWDCYFCKRNRFVNKTCVHNDGPHALAALLRGNRYKVTFVPCKSSNLSQWNVTDLPVSIVRCVCQDRSRAWPPLTLSSPMNG